MKVPFSAIPVKSTFSFGGHTWEKRSSRTAAIVTKSYAGRWFYFSAAEMVKA